MKKFNINGFMIGVSFFLAAFFVVVFVNQAVVTKTNNRNYDMFNGSDSKKMRITSKDDFLLTPEDYGDDFVIYNILTESAAEYDSDWVRVVYGKGDFPTPKMKDGKFFTEEQMLSSEPLCVIGSNVSSRSTETIDGEEYFNYEGISYRVIGHIGIQAASDLDVMVMLNWGGYFAEKTKCSGIFLIDSDNKAAIESAYAKVKEAAESDENVEFLPLVFKSTIRSFDTYSKIFYPIALAILILSIIVISDFYIKSISYKIAVKKFIGYSVPMLFGELVGQFIKYAFSGLAIAIATMLLLTFSEEYASSELGYFTTITPLTVVYALGAMLILAVILSFFPAATIYKIDTSEKLK